MRLLRTGVRPDGTKVSSLMPYGVAFRRIDDVDAHSIALYLRSLPAVERALPANAPWPATGEAADCCFEPPAFAFGGRAPR